MGLFGFGTKTKADWDREIARLNSEIASAKGRLAGYKATKQANKSALTKVSVDNAIFSSKSYIERLKGELANAKLARKNAPK